MTRDCYVHAYATDDTPSCQRQTMFPELPSAAHAHLGKAHIVDNRMLSHKLAHVCDTKSILQLVTCDSPAGKLGVTVCYDLRFPEMYQLLAWHLGAQIMLVPSAFTVATGVPARHARTLHTHTYARTLLLLLLLHLSLTLPLSLWLSLLMYELTGKAHWELLLRARAVETQCYVIAAAQAGRHNEKRESYGHSIIIDPWGEVVGKMNDPLATGIATAQIDLEHLKKIRTRMPIVNHRQLGRDCMGLPPAVLA